MGHEGSDLIISINICFSFLFFVQPPLSKKVFLFCFAAGFSVPSLTSQTENICSIPLIVGGCFIYKVVGLALFLTKADGTRERERGEREKEGRERRKREREKKKRRNGEQQRGR